MKTVVILSALVLLSACGTYKSLEQLESEALVSGDWSAVELRERQLARRQSRSSIQCSSGLVGYCVADFGKQRCTCVEQDRLRSFLNY